MSRDFTSKIRSILILCPNWVGDMAMATPVFRALRRRFPDAKITMCMRPAMVKLIAEAPWYDKILIYDKKYLHKGIRGWAHFLNDLRKSRYDLALVLPSSLRSGLIARFSRARIRLGYERFGGGWMLTHRMKKHREGNKFVPAYMGRYYGALTKMVSAFPESMELELPLSLKIRTQAQEIWERLACGSKSPKILITPGASFGSSKLWPPDYFARLISLLGKGCKAVVLISPGPGEEKIAQSVQQMTEYPVTVMPASEVDLEMLKGLISEADLLISNDTGPRHIAHAFKVPSVITMGSTDPRYSEIDLENAIVVRCEVPCSPCHLKKCPGDHRCMRGITPEQVYSAAMKQLGLHL